MCNDNGVLNDRESGWLAGQIQQRVDEHYQELSLMASPAYTLRPALTVDGNQWCALYGEDLQSGVCGFGDSPADAYEDFNREWYKKLKKVEKKKPNWSEMRKDCNGVTMGEYMDMLLKMQEGDELEVNYSEDGGCIFRMESGILKLYEIPQYGGDEVLLATSQNNSLRSLLEIAFDIK